MKLVADCLMCNVNRADYIYKLYIKDEDRRLKFIKSLCGVVEGIDQDITAPYLASEIMDRLTEEIGIDDPYGDIKRDYNRLLVSKEKDISKKIEKADDPLLLSLKYSMVGNFIDFGVMDVVDKDGLNKLLRDVEDKYIDRTTYARFKKDLKSSKNLLLLADNSGEIVLDKILLKTIKGLYPNLNIEVIVRGKPIYNDATIEDARDVGITNIANIIENGANMPGNQIDKINEEAREAIERSDIIISKGQGNFESLFPVNHNIYYVFLCKCKLFVDRFRLKQFEGVFRHEEQIRDSLSAQ